MPLSELSRVLHSALKGSSQDPDKGPPVLHDPDPDLGSSPGLRLWSDPAAQLPGGPYADDQQDKLRSVSVKTVNN